MRQENVLKNQTRIDECLLLIRARMEAMLRDGASGTVSVRVSFNDGGMLRVFLTEETVLQPGKENRQERGE
jgi:hypothetical protein